jgi:hypothetical protein
MKLEEFEALTIDDFPLVRHFHESVGQGLAQRLRAVQSSIDTKTIVFPETLSESIFRLACDFSHLESPLNDQMELSVPVPVVVDTLGHRRETIYARDVTNSNIAGMHELAALMGNPKAALAAAVSYYTGRGRDESRHAAVVFTRHAAAVGNPYAPEYLKALLAPPPAHEPSRETKPTMFRRPGTPGVSV